LEAAVSKSTGQKPFFPLVCILFFLIKPVSGLAVQAPPSAIEQRLQQIQQSLQQGNLPAATAELADAIRSFPTEPSLYNFQGVVEAQGSNYQAAETAFRKALQLSPRYTGAAVNLGRLYQENLDQDPKALQKGIQLYQEILAYDPGNAEAQYQLAFLSLRNMQYLAALSGVGKLPQDLQQSPQVLAVKTAALAGLGRRAESNAVAGKLLVHPQLAAEDLLLVLPVLGKVNRPDLEKRFFDTLANRNLHSPASLRQYGLFLEREQDLPGARQALEKAVTAPVQVSLLQDLARVAYKQKDLKGALGYLAHARDIEPKNFNLHFFFGIICVEMELIIDANKSLEEAVKLAPENPFANYALGSVLMQSSDPRKGLPYVEKYCRLMPKDARGHLALGAAYFQVGDVELASKELSPLANLPLTAAGANYYLARIAKLQGNQEEDYRLIQLSLKANPNFSDALVEMGQLEMRRKDYAAAGESLHRAVEIEPESFLGNLHLLRLYQATGDSRAEAQQKRFDEVSKIRSEKEASLLRTIEVRPYESSGQ
jgi:tetratricopeptide (TPR) repeat protein